MLFFANARGVRGLKCFSNAALTAKRLASLTGAIQRGARKARGVGERTERYNSRINSNVATGFTSGYARGPRGAAPFQLDYVRNRQVEPESFPRRDSRADQEGITRYPKRDARGGAQDRQPAERFSQREGDRRSFPRKPGVREGPLRADYRDANSSRYLREAPNAVPEYHKLGGRFLRGEGDRQPLSGRASGRESSPRAGYRDRDRDRSTDVSTAVNKVGQDRRPGERFSHREGDQRSFSRYPIARERPLHAGDRDRNRSSHEPPQAHLARSEGGRGSYTPKSRAGQHLASEEGAFVSGPAWQEPMPEKRHVTVPLSVPRSSAASEFIYGTSAVKAALHAGTRKLYKLYIYQGAGGTEERECDKEFYKLARQWGLNVRRLGEHEDDLRLLDKMSQGRPHNGYVLEASLLPNTPVEALDSVDGPGDGFTFTPGHQSAEEVAVNGTSSKILGRSRRYPFVLMLDSILDPGNLGAIIRSAAFFGVDAIALIDHNLAPFSPVTLKASSGAAEYMQYLRIKKDLDFVKRSQSNGWKFFAAIAPESASASRGGLNAVQLKEAEEALMEGPCVLVLGGEGDGLRPRLQKAADAMVGIEGAVGLNSEFGLDSLNVSVAAALMMQIFVKGSNARAGPRVSETETEQAKEDELLF